MIPSLSSVRIAGLTSIDDLTLELTTPITVLIGANGSGKSNIVGAFELLGRISDRQLQSFVVRRGGFGNLLHRSPERGREVAQLFLEVKGEDSGPGRPGYHVTLGAARDDEATIYESVTREHDHGALDTAVLGNSRESHLRRVADEHEDDWVRGLTDRLLTLLTGCRVFHFDDTSLDAPVKQLEGVANNLTLAPDARNLAPLLARIRDQDPSVYRRIVRVVQAVAPFFEDFVLKPDNGRILLRWQENGLDGAFSADELSDGTLRFMCLAVLLLQPDRPATIVLDEPELGLHPFAINQLAGLIRAAADTSGKIILATQSVTLLSHFDAGEVAVVERGSDGTTVKRLDVDALTDWLAEYSLGELWEKNLLGGRPRPDAAAPPREAADR